MKSAHDERTHLNLTLKDHTLCLQVRIQLTRKEMGYIGKEWKGCEVVARGVDCSLIIQGLLLYYYRYQRQCHVAAITLQSTICGDLSKSSSHHAQHSLTSHMTSYPENHLNMRWTFSRSTRNRTASKKTYQFPENQMQNASARTQHYLYCS